ncbi:C40 family peptidase [Enterobacteriaceae bacterium C23F]
MSVFKKMCPTLLVLVIVLAAFSANALNLPQRFTTLQSSPSQQLKSSLLKQYSRWEGTPYDFGGTRRSGIDCSALMQKIFSRHIALPRTTHQQKKRGKRVGRHELRIGDLVFFKSSPRVQHVGVYIGDSQFIHASQKVGVTISRLDNPYWAPRYETARRVIQ